MASSTTTIAVTVPADSAAFAEARAKAEGHASAGDYVAALLHRERVRQAKLEFEAKVRAGLESGPFEPMTREDWEMIEREGKARSEAERQVR